MSDFKYAEENLERVIKLPDDYPNKEAVVRRWQAELKQERLGKILDRKSKENMKK